MLYWSSKEIISSIIWSPFLMFVVDKIFSNKNFFANQDSLLDNGEMWSDGLRFFKDNA